MAVTDPTTEQLSDLRFDLDAGDPTASFTDAELIRLWQRAGGRHNGTLILAVKHLIVIAARFNDYALGQGSREEKRSQVTANLERWLARLQREGRGGSGLASIQLTTATTIHDPYAVLTDEEQA